MGVAGAIDVGWHSHLVCASAEVCGVRFPGGASRMRTTAAAWNWRRSGCRRTSRSRWPLSQWARLCATTAGRVSSPSANSTSLKTHTEVAAMSITSTWVIGWSLAVSRSRPLELRHRRPSAVVAFSPPRCSIVHWRAGLQRSAASIIDFDHSGVRCKALRSLGAGEITLPFSISSTSNGSGTTPSERASVLLS